MASCDNCTKGYVLPGEPTGTLVAEMDGAYFAPGPEGNTARAVVYLTDIFGLPLKNSKLMADELAKTLACDVWVPDLFNGKPIVNADELEPLMPDRAGVAMTLAQKLQVVFLMLRRAFALWGNRPAITTARATAFVTKLRAARAYARVGAVGYCYGGMLAVRLGGGALLDSAVVCHPGSITPAQIGAVRVPTAWACAEEDMSFGPALRREAEAIFRAREGKEGFVESEFVDYKGTAHGFACRPNLGLPEVKAGYEGALAQTIAWFNKTLPV
ncbi:hypothetical protein HWV62_45707 [Athelia sp. TMB]|nr:hypothetical protein HWV62_45707 [Athelia sp. TMB]